jgi:hypothetical protein
MDNGSFMSGFCVGFAMAIVVSILIYEHKQEEREKNLTTKIIQDYINGDLKIDTIKTTNIIKIKE